jgi:uncharacterized protein YlaI
MIPEGLGIFIGSQCSICKKVQKIREITFHKKKVQFDGTTHYLRQKLKSTFFEFFQNRMAVKRLVE